jgi:DNA invertase Pin-like site-specific DNA recombinase
MFAAASRREFDVLLFWDLSRLSREGVYETLQHLTRLSGYGVAFRSYREEYLDSCGLFKDAIIGILAALAKQERVRLSERVVAGLQRARAQGRVGGRPKATNDKMRERILEMRRDGESLAEIAAELGVSKPTVYRVIGKGNGHPELQD